MKTDDEILSLWAGAGGAFAGDPAAQTAMMPREQLLVFLRTLVDGVLAGGKTAIHRGEMTKVREFICKLAGKIA